METGQSATTTVEVGVPQGSVLGPVLFTLFVAPLAKVTKSFDIQHHQYADDTYLCIFAKKIELMNATNTIEQCTNLLYIWFSQNGLALNPSKSEAIKFRTAQTRSDGCATVVNVAGENIVMSPSIKTLSIVLDSQLSFDNHVAAVMKACYFHMCALRHIRSSLPD